MRSTGVLQKPADWGKIKLVGSGRYEFEVKGIR